VLEVADWSLSQPVHIGQEAVARMTVTGKYPATDDRGAVLAQHLALVDLTGNAAGRHCDCPRPHRGRGAATTGDGHQHESPNHQAPL
jgi:hypothetical protein